MPLVMLLERMDDVVFDIVLAVVLVGNDTCIFCAVCVCVLIVYYELSHRLCSSLLYPLILNGVLRSALAGMLR